MPVEAVWVQWTHHHQELCDTGAYAARRSHQRYAHYGHKGTNVVSNNTQTTIFKWCWKYVHAPPAAASTANTGRMDPCFHAAKQNTDFSIQNVTTDIEAQTRHKLLNFLIQFLWASENWSLSFLLLADRSEPVWFSVSVVHLLWFVRSPADLVCDKCLLKTSPFSF